MGELRRGKYGQYLAAPELVLPYGTEILQMVRATQSAHQPVADEAH